MSIKCLIIDDEPLAIDVLKTHLKQISEIELLGTFQDSLKAFEFVKDHRIDLIFLDIEMPVLTGVDFVKSLESPPKIIFTTAHRDYAIDGYELNVVDYLLKPISFIRLFKAINKYKVLVGSHTSETPKEVKTSNDHIYVNSNKKFIKISFDEILYVESIKDYVRIHLVDGQKVITKGTIGNFLEKLPQEFLRIHRSYVVNTNKVTAFTSLDVEIGTKEIPIGASYKNETINFLKE
jgi:DNA-binding LytR/AlgR family response regulator